MTTRYRPVSEWGSKARKEEARVLRKNHRAAAIEEGVWDFAADADEYDEPVYDENAPPVDSGLAATRCGICGERLGTTDPDLLADQYVYEVDGTLDYISLFHKACAEAH